MILIIMITIKWLLLNDDFYEDSDDAYNDFDFNGDSEDNSDDKGDDGGDDEDDDLDDVQEPRRKAKQAREAREAFWEAWGRKLGEKTN